MNSWRLIVKNEIEELVALPGFVERIAAEVGLSVACAMEINLALEEAITNVIMYAYPQGRRDEIDLCVSESENMLIFTLSDRGEAFDPTSVVEADVTLSVADRQIGGLGVFLIRKLMDSVTYRRESDVNVLIMRKTVI